MALLMRRVTVCYIICFAFQINHLKLCSLNVVLANVLRLFVVKVKVNSWHQILPSKSGLHDGRLTRNNPLKIIPEWGPFYIISLDIFIHSWGESGTSVIHFRKEADDGLKKRDPAVYIFMGNPVPRLTTYFHIGESLEHNTINYEERYSQRWINVLIAQYYSRVTKFYKYDISSDISLGFCLLSIYHRWWK